MDPSSRRPLDLPCALLGLASAGALVSGLLGCGAPEMPPSASDGPDPSSPPSIVLLSIDTLRADRLPAWGYEGVETPAIDALAARSVLFERAFSPVPLTGPAHASLLSGRQPWEHGVRDNIGYPLPRGGPWLPELLRDAGYRTLGAVSAVVLGADAGWDRGFDHFDDRVRDRVGLGTGGVQRRGDATLDAVRSELEAAARSDEPFFLFLHLYDPHTPWAAPEPFAGRHAHPYDDEIAWVDRVVAELLDRVTALEAENPGREVAIVLTSDHGEGLEDHGEREHGVLLYREALQVPLLLTLPAGEGAGRRVATPVELVDLAPTLLELAGVSGSPELAGRSLLPLARGLAADAERGPLLAETFYPRIHFGWSELSSALDWPWHYVRGPRPELYDLAADPTERHDLASEHRGIVRRLDRLLAETISPLEAPAAASGEALAELRALGYLGGGARPGAEGPLPHPADRVGILRDLDDAIGDLGAGRVDAAITGFQEIVAREPGLVDAREYLGRARAAAGDLDGALAAYLAGVEASDGAPHLVLAAAGVEARRGRWDAVSDLVEPWLPAHPGDLRLRLVASQARMRSGDLETARILADDGLALAPDDADALYQRGSVAIGLEDLDTAERYLRRALDRSPRHPAALGDLAVLLVHQGRAGEAEETVRRLLAAHPQDPTAHRLARRLGITSGRGDGASGVRSGS